MNASHAGKIPNVPKDFPGQRYTLMPEIFRSGQPSPDFGR